VIVYRKGAPLRVRRAPSPSPPFFCASAIAPYGARRSEPLAVDYLLLRAHAAERLEVTVAENVVDQLERMRPMHAPVLVEVSGAAESVFMRGSEIAQFLEANDLPALELISTRGSLPDFAPRNTVVAIAAWPLEPQRLDSLFAEAKRRVLTWGVFVPLVYPITTELEPLEQLADLAALHGASFFSATPVETDPVARQTLARTMEIEHDDDRYAMLFHGSVEPIQVSTERHIAALAAERGMLDRVAAPGAGVRSNWNAAILLTSVASRMLAMELDLDLAASISRAASVIAALDKPLARIASSASLGIIGGLDETTVTMLEEWLESGSASFAEFVDEQWRLRRG
jgi:hypothetical protein